MSSDVRELHLEIVHLQLLDMLFLSYCAALTLFSAGLGLVKASVHAMETALWAKEIFSS